MNTLCNQSNNDNSSALFCDPEFDSILLDVMGSESRNNRNNHHYETIFDNVVSLEKPGSIPVGKSGTTLPPPIMKSFFIKPPMEEKLPVVVVANPLEDGDDVSLLDDDDDEEEDKELDIAADFYLAMPSSTASALGCALFDDNMMKRLFADARNEDQCREGFSIEGANDKNGPVTLEFMDDLTVMALAALAGATTPAATTTIAATTISPKLSVCSFKKHKKQDIPSSVVTGLYNEDDDNVSLLHDNPEEDDDNCLPEVVIDVLEFVLGDDPEWYESDDEEDSEE